jgi:hypothetical protein
MMKKKKAVRKKKKKTRGPNKPRMVTECVDIDLSYSTLKNAIPYLEELRKKYGDNASIEIREEWGSYTTKLEFRRPENEEEREKRLDAAKRHKEWRQQQYESLKKEFEK